MPAAAAAHLPELILHIGTTKTGSTSIQHMLHKQRRNMPSQGVLLSETTTDGRHIMMATAFTSYEGLIDDAEHSRWEGEAPVARLQSYLAQFSEEMRSLPPSIKRVILSAEQFSMYVRKPEDIKRLHDFLAPFFSKMTVVVYLRRQDSHFASLYSEFLRFGDVHQADMSRLRAFHHNYDYAAFVGRWADAFGEASMRPRIFERGAGGRFDVVQDFFEICGLDPTLKGEDGAEDRNVSMNRAGQQLLIGLGALIREQTGKRNVAGTGWNRICAYVTAISPGRGWEPTRAQAEAFMQKYAASNEALRARWFPERETAFSMDFSSLPETEVETPVEESLRVAQLALIYATNQAVEREQKLLIEKAQLAERLGDQKVRRHSLVQAVRCNGDSPAARVEMARFLIDQGNTTAARYSVDAALRLAPKNPVALALNRKLPKVEAPPRKPRRLGARSPRAAEPVDA